ncbi:hypothetical protein EN781_00475 [Mesorhizobium sp. M4A.F.Ca.ET.090.04.2.1]|uniref:hypothetical protein n=1 Tax=Mesorhizobium sp. M4A.F.Ca.ET.090.04.2.1 TaxID=2496663 RepID=UPI000FCCBF92|nr:hypothetical protein [Mesorhizobium sp. M4A.F.Ca.ET.090.04.2.1]RVC47644.1 hypothetical protein EN781_00475 [Mesorhizobium sp. M4A.F.Ca.ET.090.04.2.1]
MNDQQTALRVKALEWNAGGFAHTPLGIFYRVTDEGSFWKLGAYQNNSETYSAHPTEQSAKDYAYADFERRVRSVLV